VHDHSVQHDLLYGLTIRPLRGVVHKKRQGCASTGSSARERVALHKIDVGVTICSFHCDLCYATLYFWSNGMTDKIGLPKMTRGRCGDGLADAHRFQYAGVDGG
jgi:hypothetical protein